MDSGLLNIIYVDDDKVDIMNLQRQFMKYNTFSQLYIAKDGIHALDMLRGTNGQEMIWPVPKIILLDLRMPRMDGLEFLREVRRDKALHSISVFALTISYEHIDILEAYNYNVAGYIVKPLSSEDFDIAVNTLANYWALCFNR